MRLPFRRTFDQMGTKGFVPTLSTAIIVLVDTVSTHLRYVPEQVVVEVNKSKMLLFPRKGAIHLELFLHKKREPLCTDYLLKSGVLEKGDVALDIGANIGYYVLVESRLVGAQGKVYAVEPVLENFRLLRANVRLNNLKNVSNSLLAFGDHNSRSKIYVSNFSNLCAMDKKAVGGEVVGEQEVSLLTVDAFLEGKQTPKLIRMDVEGYEYEIIKGMSQTLKEDIRILIELHPSILSRQKMDELLQILELNDFHCRFVVFERKVNENAAMESLKKKAGDSLPLWTTNISIPDLKKLIRTASNQSPNVFFEKHRTKNQTVYATPVSAKPSEHLAAQVWLNPQ